ncbi:16S rRNA (cytosine(1402)-N(4))-methyltransferase RsmH [Marivita sp. XM-24bin2]|jgi:16S rRNA (cytosine1402-N4)-methyltransferase|uniref:16S rRNA (cytosine(1402)-N(4))-methyltransferase RsmH n=1 Tax=unclassified Marivita TaxID=2632480 RepID=UPI000D7A159A|nr:16S rRNA (cytosine(1402)-N(4))-methyltransferase RsmH [Marivita sp. XM-24bin2]MCR9107270.1 16S rRNA (cytosine(1402)-N(4))-methyltransferase RsmH [Paracoccaceae bacterium]PWL36603.1 MAG: 16S rRNA (cytosine(1402)-N(4))-methyltransferase [Marivita sp. XM-24bin2]
MSAAAATPSTDPHIPVLLAPLLRAVAPVSGVWVDGTFGAGGYARGLIEAGADKVIGIDRDPLAHEMAAQWVSDFEGRIELHRANFAEMDQIASDVDGVVLDLGVSSMQLDQAERGFSFMKDGPLDMRMGQDGPSAADIVNEAAEVDLADILYTYGEERASRRIAKAIVTARRINPISRTLELAGIIETCLPRPKPGQSHPATRSFQALRIAVNDEYGALMKGLMAAERALKPGGLLAVVSFHSVEDRMVKRFLQARGGKAGRANRYAPEIEAETPAFEILTRKAVGPDDDELAANPRSRSAKLRVARRTDAPAGEIDAGQIALPLLKEDR